MVHVPDRELERIVVIYPGKKRFALTPKIEAVPFGELPDDGLFGGAE